MKDPELSGDSMMQDLVRLRADFDSLFAEAPREREAAGEDLLAIRLGGDPYALRLDEISFLSPARPLALLPNAPPAFLGLAGLRGDLLPAWDLAALLGYPGSTASSGWMVVCKGDSLWSAAFEGLDGTLKARRADLSPFAGGGPAENFADEVCHQNGLLRPVLSLKRILPIIQKGSHS
jgi:chemotaxis signal transduction protein